ncbi:SusC/RagA family TonB-linked outer membrane protein [Sphingobacterium griseoflavum]|uniref:SusC/RagA family TonB-linked outer membrane protein n=1 Tax=Sphingobacterium griseoflavum TaxID=1474952 RepID=A0ABQ3HW57_9SPHI|nr:SusC/RagA family TonB-linked outer membrane protein [Sphingobacterium griseoflavum]GHE37513.1 SusC/RagA family TonB-linked outer membrane protein [Sphingobacterium griseoflavum]
MKQKLLSILFVLTCVVGVSFAQNRQVSGKVTSATDGSPIGGVSITLVGGSTGTQTDGTGNYSIQVPINAELNFSYIGYLSQRVSVGNRSMVNVQLVSNEASLEEVVITGYTQLSKEKSVGATSSIGGEKLEDIPMASFTQRLQGLAPGVNVLSGTGQPGTNAAVRIRGVNSIAGSTAPLYVVDGIPIDEATFSTMNPNDFENISILKDASTTALYGSRGGNGVVVITTKRGKAGGLRLNYSYQGGVDVRTTGNFEMMNTSQLLALQEQGRAGLGWTLSPDNTNSSLAPERRAQVRDSISQINTRWDELFFQNGKFQSHEVSASGGNEETKFFTSFNYYSQDGIAVRSGLDRYTMRLNADHQSGRVKLGVQSNIGWSKSNFIESEAAVALANPFAAAYLAFPWENPYGPDGRIITTNNTTNGFSPFNPFTSRYGVLGDSRIGSNALDRLDNTTLKTDQLKGTVGANFAYDIYDGLSFKTNLGLDYRQTVQERSIYPGSHAGVAVQQGNQGSYNNNVFRRLNLIGTSGFDYRKSFGEHSLAASALFETIRRRDSEFFYTGYGINPKLLNTPAGITGGTNTNGMIPSVGGGKTQFGINSYIGLVNYSYADKYTVQGTYRRDGSSKLPIINRWQSFYAIGGNWNAKKEDFLANVSFLDQLIVRLSYGQTATGQNQSNFGYLPTYGNVSYAGVAGIAPATPGNPDYNWEYTSVLNVGLDFGFWNNRLKGSVDVYNSKTNNLFIDQQLSRTSGFGSLAINAGNLQNKGVEVNLIADVISTSTFVWSVNANIAYNKNEITSLGQEEEYPQGTSIIRVGLPIGSHYAVGYAGVDPQTGDPLYYNRNEETKEMDGTTTNVFDNAGQSVAQWGTSVAPTSGGFGTSLRYKGLSFSTLFAFFKDQHLFNNESFFLASTSNFSAYNQQTRMADAWQQPGDVTNIARLGSQRQFSSFDIEDASFLRLRNITIRYDLPTSWFAGTNYIKGVGVFAMGQNLATWTKWTGFDPENSINIYNFRYPAPRNYSFGIDVRF